MAFFQERPDVGGRNGDLFQFLLRHNGTGHALLFAVRLQKLCIAFAPVAKAEIMAADKACCMIVFHQKGQKILPRHGLHLFVKGQNHHIIHARWGHDLLIALPHALADDTNIAAGLLRTVVDTNAAGQISFIAKDDGGEAGSSESFAPSESTYFAAVSLKVTPAGAVTATLTFDTGKTAKDKKTKKTVKVYYKPTCATVLVPTSAPDADPFTGYVPVYFAPSPANNFPGYAAPVPIAERAILQL